MTISINTIVSLSAFFLSIASFALSVKNHIYAKQIKGIELKSVILMKYMEIRNRIYDISEYSASVKMEASKTNDLGLYKIVDDRNKTEELIKKIDKQFKIIDSSKPTNIASLYESIYHELHDISNLCVQEKVALEGNVNDYKNQKVS